MANKHQAGKNIKIVAQGFNPPLFTEYWLRKEGLIPVDCELKPPPLSMPQFTQISTKKFVLIVLPDQMQFNIIEDPKFGTDFVKSVSNKISSLIFNALGFNFDYFVPENEIKNGLYFVPKNKLFQEFKTSDARFGTFLTKNFENSRLSLSVKPTKVKDPEGNELNMYHYSLNYHFDLSKGDNLTIINSTLDKWNKYASYSDKLMTLI